MNKTVFVSQLNKDVQEEIYFKVMDYYLNEGYSQEESEEYTDNARSVYHYVIN